MNASAGVPNDNLVIARRNHPSSTVSTLLHCSILSCRRPHTDGSLPVFGYVESARAKRRAPLCSLAWGALCHAASGADSADGVAYAAVGPAAPKREQLDEAAEPESTNEIGSGAHLHSTLGTSNTASHLHIATSDENEAFTNMAVELSVLPPHSSDEGREAVPVADGAAAAPAPQNVAYTAPSGLPPLLSAGVSFLSAVVVLHSQPSTSESTASVLDEAWRDSPQVCLYDGDDDALGERGELGEDIMGSDVDDDDDDDDDGAFAVRQPSGRPVHVGPTEPAHALEGGLTMVSIHRPLPGLQSPFAPPSSLRGSPPTKASAGSLSDSAGALVSVVLPGRRMPHNNRGEPRNRGGSTTSHGRCHNSYNSHDSSFSLSLSAISAQHLSLARLPEDVSTQRAQLAVSRTMTQRRRRTQRVTGGSERTGAHEVPRNGRGSTAFLDSGPHNEHVVPVLQR